MLNLFLSLSLQSFERDARSKDGDRGQIQNAIISALSKRHNSSILLSVVEVKVETPVDSPAVGELEKTVPIVSVLHTTPKYC